MQPSHGSGFLRERVIHLNNRLDPSCDCQFFRTEYPREEPSCIAYLLPLNQFQSIER